MMSMTVYFADVSITEFEQVSACLNFLCLWTNVEHISSVPTNDRKYLWSSREFILRKKTHS